MTQRPATLETHTKFHEGNRWLVCQEIKTGVLFSSCDKGLLYIFLTHQLGIWGHLRSISRISIHMAISQLRQKDWYLPSALRKVGKERIIIHEAVN